MMEQVHYARVVGLTRPRRRGTCAFGGFEEAKRGTTWQDRLALRSHEDVTKEGLFLTCEMTDGARGCHVEDNWQL